MSSNESIQNCLFSASFLLWWLKIHRRTLVGGPLSNVPSFQVAPMSFLIRATVFRVPTICPEVDSVHCLTLPYEFLCYVLFTIPLNSKNIIRIVCRWSMAVLEQNSSLSWKHTNKLDRSLCKLASWVLSTSIPNLIAYRWRTNEFIVHILSLSGIEAVISCTTKATPHSHPPEFFRFWKHCVSVRLMSNSFPNW